MYIVYVSYMVYAKSKYKNKSEPTEKNIRFNYIFYQNTNENRIYFAWMSLHSKLKTLKFIYILHSVRQPQSM